MLKVLSPEEAKALISKHSTKIKKLTKKITEMQEIVNKKYEHGLMCWWSSGVKELREDAKKYFNDIETLGKGNILRDLEHQIETDTTLIEFLQKELDHVSKELKDLKRRNGFLDF